MIIRKMFVIIPLGGNGQRFKQNGYIEPKALIKVAGKPILFYLLDTLVNSTQNIEFVYIPYNSEYVKYRFEDILRKSYPHLQFRFLLLDKQTEGAAETIHIALSKLDCEDQPILCLDSDNFYKTDVVTQWNGRNRVFSVKNTLETPLFSYLDIEPNTRNVRDIVEKVKISDHACTGAYGFISCKTLMEFCGTVLSKNIRQKNEYYTSSVIREMISANHKFEHISINEEDFVCLGTPTQLKMFYHIHYIQQGLSQKQLRVCFDFDNTLVTYPKIPNDYTSVEPIPENIRYLQYLKELGHIIIIYTARRMKTHSGNVGKILSDIGRVTFNTLDKFEIPYDEIYFGKPYADVYIDDLAVNCFDNIEKRLGIYNDQIHPRSFNQLVKKGAGYVKSSADLSGEIYYYNHIPSDLSHLFPKILDYDKINSAWFEMECIHGTPVSVLYVSELLSGNQLRKVMDNIRTIQQSPIISSSNINIYGNYCAKLKARYDTYDYSLFPGSDETYHEIYNDLLRYENEKCGKMTMIHGDPVFTNIIVTENEEMKFIDMRGKIDTSLTIYGDWLYDWAKIYQSLIGYDEILMDKPVSLKYKQHMIQEFEHYFLTHFSQNNFIHLKQITKSLLFSLLPLHCDKTHRKFYNLISTLYV